MGEHGKILLLEAANDLFEQNAVLKASAGQRDGVEAGVARDFATGELFRHCDDDLGEALVEARRDQRRRRLQDEIAEQRSPHRQRLNSR